MCRFESCPGHPSALSPARVSGARERSRGCRWLGRRWLPGRMSPAKRPQGAKLSLTRNDPVCRRPRAGTRPEKAPASGRAPKSPFGFYLLEDPGIGLNGRGSAVGRNDSKGLVESSAAKVTAMMRSSAVRWTGSTARGRSGPRRWPASSRRRGPWRSRRRRWSVAASEGLRSG